MSSDAILVRGAREHNLKNIDVAIPRDKLVVITGVSGSGKSSLAFDTIYAEGQRRYVESLSAYARQFLGQMQKPDVDHIDGLSPAISIDQKSGNRNPRSTVGTVTEIFDYLRLLYARVGKPHCPNDGTPIARQTVQQIVDSVQELAEGTRFMILGPIVKDRKGEYLSIFDDLRKSGYVRVRVDGDVSDLSEEFKLAKTKRHSIEVVVDRLVSGQISADEPDPAIREAAVRRRLTDSIETALKLGEGTVLIAQVDGEETVYSEAFSCSKCGFSMGEIAPRNFSFNTPHGACPDCTGLGHRLEVDPELVLPDKSLSLEEGAVKPWARSATMARWYQRMLNALAADRGFSMTTPVADLNPDHVEAILHGTGDHKLKARFRGHRGRREYEFSFEGVIRNVQRRFRETDSDYVRSEMERYMRARPCPSCRGKRLKPESLAVTIDDINISELVSKSVADALAWIIHVGGRALDRRAGPSPTANGEFAFTEDGRSSSLPEPSRKGAAPRFTETMSPVFSARELMIAHQILKELHARVSFLQDVGLDYLTLDRAAGSLSGGEAQRIRLATQIGSGLMGVLYVCDEPSIGLHASDEQRLIATLKRLRDLGNTMLIVEHDEAMMRAADWLIDLGPGAGEHGGTIVAAGPPQEIMKHVGSVTGDYLSGRREIAAPSKRRPGNGKYLDLIGARENNLRNLNVRFPLGTLICITGVSGSGKSTLVDDILSRALMRHFYNAKEAPGAHDRIEGLDEIDKIVVIDQSAIGRTPRSNPATYTGTFTPMRELFATVPESRTRGYKAGRFSFNVKGGRCEACAGDGFVKIEMNFLPDITIPCEVCKGQRYNREALEILFRGKNIAEVLDMTIEESLDFFTNFPSIKRKLETLNDVGLGYMHLGQPATTLSGGEAQRVKLATELSKRSTGKTLYVLDEPTTGLSFQDCQLLLDVIQRIVDKGNTVILIEHHLDMIKSADWLIDLGPGGGVHGGKVVGEGTPEKIASLKRSQTGRFLSPMLKRTNRRQANAPAKAG